MSSSTPASYFEEMYSDTDDPWGLAHRWYERRKYACSLAALPKPRYRNGFEPGCSIGVLSTLLAERCERLLCVDPVDAAVEQASLRLAEHEHVRVERRAVPDSWPGERFDLVVISELAYYLDEPTRAQLWTKVTDSLEPDGTLLAVHWRWPVLDYPAGGDTVHAELAALPALQRTARYADPDFRLDVYQRLPLAAPSVATGEGLR